MRMLKLVITFITILLACAISYKVGYHIRETQYYNNLQENDKACTKYYERIIHEMKSCDKQCEMRFEQMAG